MNHLLLKTYHSLPYLFRTIGASLWGYYLKSWRYSSDTEKLVEMALERENWSKEQWKIYQDNKLAFILNRAATKVPFYRNYWQSRRNNGDYASWEILENWPILHKESLRNDPKAFLADDCNLQKMYFDHTSGTTGTPLSIWSSKDTIREWYALLETRCRRWFDLNMHDRWGILGGQCIVPFKQSNPPFWVWNKGMNQLYMSSLHISEQFAPYYLDAIKKYRLKYLLGYTTSIYWLALIAKKHNIKNLNLNVCITNAEPVFQFQRNIIEDAFNCPVQETYGQAEMASAASACENGTLHIWPEVGFIEILGDYNQPVSPGVPGRLICTGLLNPDMPLIRYDVMDMAQFSMEIFRCSCGRSLPALDQIVGRYDDVLITKDGRNIVQIDTVFGPELQIKEAQIVQETVDLVRVLIIPAEGWNNQQAESIISGLTERLGNITVKIDIVDHIERSFAGKFRIIVSKVKNYNLPLM